jgi:hypothetical protein
MVRIESVKASSEAARRRLRAPGSRLQPCFPAALGWKGGGCYCSTRAHGEIKAGPQGQCAFVGGKGRCTERGCLEIHQLVPFAVGGLTTVQNLELRCRRHNAHEAELFFGPLVVREIHARDSVQTERNRLATSGFRVLQPQFTSVGVARGL